MTYTLATPLHQVRGIGQTWAHRLAAHEIFSVGDLLLITPLRYDDRSTFVTVDQLLHEIPTSSLFQSQSETKSSQPPVCTLLATVQTVSTFRRGPRTIQTATLRDETGTLKATWFNSQFVMTTLQVGEQYLFAGKYSDTYHTLTQPTIERVSNQESIHTGRLVPLYTSTLGLQPGTVRRILKNILDNLEIPESVSSLDSLRTALTQLHFPSEANQVVAARERLAIEELLIFHQYTTKLKQDWITHYRAPASLSNTLTTTQLLESHHLPYTLTHDQKDAISSIITDLQKSHPMNRLLLGDVGSGKTVVAGICAAALVAQGNHVCFLAPTRILAEQHAQTLTQLFPHLPIQLITAVNKAHNKILAINASSSSSTAQLFIGTQALYTQIPELQPALVIIDEQQRFGVLQRTDQVSWTDESGQLQLPHTLTMTATPIPRSLVLTMFNHVSVSLLEEMPYQRQVKTWNVPLSKKKKAVRWLDMELQAPDTLLLVICPLVDPNSKAAENASAAISTWEEMQQLFPYLKVGLLHGQQKKQDQRTMIEQITNHQVNIVVATSLVEVGIDLPQATHLWVENADRFGLSSLHQLRGRVGRRGQAGYCLLFSTSQSEIAKKRLKLFAATTKGQQLAEADLELRGAGELFGLRQHGWSGLRFASWTNQQLLSLTTAISQELPATWHSPLEEQLLQSQLHAISN